MIPVRISTIEKLDIEKFAVGRVAIVHLDPEGPDERVVIMQATAKVKGDRTTVEFTGLGECIFKTRRCERGRKTYTVKHPYRPSDGPGVSGIAVPSMMLYFPPAWNLDNLADVMEKEGRKADADEVRKVARRLAAEARRR